MASNKRRAASEDDDSVDSSEKKISKKLRPGGGLSSVKAHAMNSKRVGRMSHIRVMPEESDEDSLFVSPYRPGIKERIEEAKRMRTSSATPAAAPTSTSAVHNAEDQLALQNVEEDDDVQSSYEDANMHLAPDVETTSVEERNVPLVTSRESSAHIAPVTNMSGSIKAGPAVQAPTSTSSLTVPSGKNQGITTKPASPAISNASSRGRHDAEMIAMREKLQKLKERKAAIEEENQVDLEAIDRAQVSPSAFLRFP